MQQECNESAQERRIALHKSGHQHDIQEIINIKSINCGRKDGSVGLVQNARVHYKLKRRTPTTKTFLTWNPRCVEASSCILEVSQEFKVHDISCGRHIQRKDVTTISVQSGVGFTRAISKLKTVVWYRVQHADNSLLGLSWNTFPFIHSDTNTLLLLYNVPSSYYVQ